NPKRRFTPLQQNVRAHQRVQGRAESPGTRGSTIVLVLPLAIELIRKYSRLSGTQSAPQSFIELLPCVFADHLVEQFLLNRKSALGDRVGIRNEAQQLRVQ